MPAAALAGALVAAALAGAFAAGASATVPDAGVVARVRAAFGAAFSAGAALATFAGTFAASPESDRPARAIAALALPAAVWAPLAFSALPAAMRALAAFAAAAVPVVLVMRAVVCTLSPPRAALTFSARRALRRAAAFGWRAPVFAARSRAEYASARDAVASPSSAPVAIFRVLVTRVLAFVRRGPLTASRRSAWRTRFLPDGVRAPVQPRGV